MLRLLCSYLGAKLHRCAKLMLELLIDQLCMVAGNEHVGEAQHASMSCIRSNDSSQQCCSSCMR